MRVGAADLAFPSPSNAQNKTPSADGLRRKLKAKQRRKEEVQTSSSVEHHGELKISQKKKSVWSAHVNSTNIESRVLCSTET